MVKVLANLDLIFYTGHKMGMYLLDMIATHTHLYLWQISVIKPSTSMLFKVRKKTENPDKIQTDSNPGSELNRGTWILVKSFCHNIAISLAKRRSGKTDWVTEKMAIIICQDVAYIHPLPYVLILK